MRKKRASKYIYIYILYLLVNRSFSNLDKYCTADSIKRRCTKLLCKCAYYVGVPWYGRYAFHITVSKCQAAALRTPPPRWDLSYLIQPMQVMTCCQDGWFMTKMHAPPFTKAGFWNRRALRWFTDNRSNRSLEGDGQTQSVDRSDRWMFSFHNSCFPVWCLNRYIPWLYHGVWREFGLRRLRWEG